MPHQPSNNEVVDLVEVDGVYVAKKRTASSKRPRPEQKVVTKQFVAPPIPQVTNPKAVQNIRAFMGGIRAVFEFAHEAITEIDECERIYRERLGRGRGF